MIISPTSENIDKNMFPIENKPISGSLSLTQFTDLPKYHPLLPQITIFETKM